MRPENTASPPSLRRTLRDRYEARNRKSCLPCRERKVRCNRQQPCLTCVKRGHTDLCSYPDSVPQKGTNVEGNAEGSPSSPGVGQGNFQRQSSSASPSFLGASSLLALAGQNELPQGQSNGRQEAFETGIFPLLGMEPLAAEGDDIAASDGVKLADSSIPSDQEIMELFSHFKSRVYPFQPMFYDVDQVESIISSLIGREAEPRRLTTHFLCLFHAILAAGAQFSDRPVDQRSKLFHKHLRHALKYIGIFELVLNPSIEIIQGLIVLAQVLQNDVNPRAAWILSGITIRSALCLGVHKRGPRPESSQLSAGDASNLRMAIVWQDTLLSMAFGRNPSSQEMHYEADLPTLHQRNKAAARLTYRQAMNWICTLSTKFFGVASSPPELRVYNEIFQFVADIEASCANHIRERSMCQSLLEVQEHYSFILHRNFGISFLCRPILSRQGRQSMTEEDASAVLHRVLDALKQSAKAFISLRSISSHSTRSWAFLHNGLCSALMLGFIEQTKGTDEVKDIQTKLIQSLETNEDLQGGSLSNAYQKALSALKAQRKLAEESNSARAAEPDQAIPEPCAPSSPLATNTQFQQHYLDPSDLSSFDMDEWVRSVDFGSYSPLDAYDFIMSDQFAPGPMF